MTHPLRGGRSTVKTVLVTGGAGFIGSEIVRQLDTIGKYKIKVLDCLTEQIHGKEPDTSYLYSSIKENANSFAATYEISMSSITQLTELIASYIWPPKPAQVSRCI